MPRLPVSRLEDVLSPRAADGVGPATRAGREDEPERGAPAVYYLVIVKRGQAALYRYLTRQFHGDAQVQVLVDRRDASDDLRRLPEPDRRRGERRHGRDFDSEHRLPWVFVARSHERASVEPRPRSHHLLSPQGRERSRASMDSLEDRQRIDRWIEESQYLIGRMIPGLLDDRDRLRGKLEAAEQECERLRLEVGDLRKQVSDLQSETQYFRGEHAAIAEALGKILEGIGQVQKPLSDMYRRLQVGQPSPPVSPLA